MDSTSQDLIEAHERLFEALVGILDAEDDISSMRFFGHLVAVMAAEAITSPDVKPEILAEFQNLIDAVGEYAELNALNWDTALRSKQALVVAAFLEGGVEGVQDYSPWLS